MNALVQQIQGTKVPQNAVAIWWLGQETVVLKGGGLTIGIDLYLTDYPGGMPRRYDPLFKPEEASGFDICFVTHDHIDHLDPWSLKGVAANSPQCEYVVPAPAMAKLEGVVPMGKVHPSFAGRPLTVKGVNVTPVKGAHEVFEDAEKGHRFQGFLMELNGVRLLHLGDTVMYPDLVETLKGLKPDVLMVPINGADWFRNQNHILGNLNFREAAELTVACGAKLGIPMHYDLFAGNAEWPGRYVDHIYQYYPTSAHCAVLARGQRYIYVNAD